MIEYQYSIPSQYADFTPVSQAETEELAKSLLQFLDVDHAELELSLLVHFVGVCHFKGKDRQTGRNATGWIVGGGLPHLELSDNEIKTPIEALAIYALYEKTWLDAKGIPKDDGSVPIYRVPPKWTPLTFSPGWEVWRMGALTSFLAWTLVRKNADALMHPEIRERCMRRGWIKR